MRAMVAERFGLDSLELRELDRPAVCADQVLLRVHASSVNPADWYRVTGPSFIRLMGEGLRKPKTAAVGTDVAGRVELVGKDVTGLQPGDEVFGIALGAWAEFAVARPTRLGPKPPDMSFEEAAATPIAAITALQALRDHGRVQPGHKVLINGASGGVGPYAVQLAVWLGAEVTAVCSSANVDLVRSLGADHVVDYTQEDFTRRAGRHDVMLDIAGSRSLRAARTVLTPKATVVVVGAKMSGRGLGPLRHIIGMRLGSVGRGQAVRLFTADVTRADLLVLSGLLADGSLRSVVDRRYDLGQVTEALQYLGEGHARGKIVITV